MKEVLMRLLSAEVLIIAAIFILCYGTEHIQLAVGGLAGYLSKEVTEIIKEKF